MKTLSKTLVSVGLGLALSSGACSKKEESADKGKEKATAPKPAEAPKVAPKPVAPKPVKQVEMALPKTGLALMLPEGSLVEESIIAGADQITLPGVQSKFVVKPGVDKTLEFHLKWAQGHKIQVFKKEIVKEGDEASKTYTYIHQVEMGGVAKVVFMQGFQIEEKNFTCFSNADNEAAAMMMKAACATVKKGAVSAIDPE